jgi:hypothetical protein
MAVHPETAPARNGGAGLVIVAVALGAGLLALGQWLERRAAAQRPRAQAPVEPDPLLDALARAPEEDEALSPEEEAAMARGLDEAQRGAWRIHRGSLTSDRIPA